MSRPLRLEFSGALYHITSRGDRREPIYEDDEDRALFLEVLGRIKAEGSGLASKHLKQVSSPHVPPSPT